ncbi:MAG TPA: hypothetical protein PLZ78_15370 [Spirochaetota bacterium]|nr:hypothetical protein [Spirochaetota bacterium]
MKYFLYLWHAVSIVRFEATKTWIVARREFIYWLHSRVFGRDYGDALHVLVRWAWRILFPVESFLLTNKYLNFDPATRTFTFYGNTFHASVFEYWSRSGMRPGELFSIEKREGGVLTLRRHDKRERPEDILQRIYDSEMNASFSWVWDGGVEWELDIPGGTKAYGHADNVSIAVEDLGVAVVCHFPNSEFARTQKALDKRDII